MASVADSVAPDVNTRSRGWTPRAAATRPRASSRMARASRPAACTEEGLPKARSARRTAASAWGLTGVMALWSR